MYACIWDAGGRDKIAAGDAIDVRIDLRMATLEYEFGGGGWLSFADNIFGGYTDRQRRADRERRGRRRGPTP